MDYKQHKSRVIKEFYDIKTLKLQQIVFCLEMSIFPLHYGNQRCWFFFFFIQWKPLPHSCEWRDQIALGKCEKLSTQSLRERQKNVSIQGIDNYRIQITTLYIFEPYALSQDICYFQSK